MHFDATVRHIVARCVFWHASRPWTQHNVLFVPLFNPFGVRAGKLNYAWGEIIDANVERNYFRAANAWNDEGNEFADRRFTSRWPPIKIEYRFLLHSQMRLIIGHTRVRRWGDAVLIKSDGRNVVIRRIISDNNLCALSGRVYQF